MSTDAAVARVLAAARDLPADRDGGHFIMGVRAWDASSEGQEPGKVPPPGRDRHADPLACRTCGGYGHAPGPITDGRKACGSCLRTARDRQLADLRKADGEARREAARSAAKRLRSPGLDDRTRADLHEILDRACPEPSPDRARPADPEPPGTRRERRARRFAAAFAEIASR